MFHNSFTSHQPLELLDNVPPGEGTTPLSKFLETTTVVKMKHGPRLQSDSLSNGSSSHAIPEYNSFMSIKDHERLSSTTPAALTHSLCCSVSLRPRWTPHAVAALS
ncbi:hypothetical protein EYF80_042986 [Liparis tanakae]|uniref:Uncharacterized protein n=1 Tax=Liparis tanakae TaxID=230148 RepID=A0A4Z2FZT6_9TELE|nr:hypothetical protein EYF80_042986 [Liparis tanakae]